MDKLKVINAKRKGIKAATILECCIAGGLFAYDKPELASIYLVGAAGLLIFLNKFNKSYNEECEKREIESEIRKKSEKSHEELNQYYNMVLGKTILLAYTLKLESPAKFLQLYKYIIENNILSVDDPKYVKVEGENEAVTVITSGKNAINYAHNLLLSDLFNIKKYNNTMISGETEVDLEFIMYAVDAIAHQIEETRKEGYTPIEVDKPIFTKAGIITSKIINKIEYNGNVYYIDPINYKTYVDTKKNKTKLSSDGSTLKVISSRKSKITFLKGLKDSIKGNSITMKELVDEEKYAKECINKNKDYIEAFYKSNVELYDAISNKVTEINNIRESVLKSVK